MAKGKYAHRSSGVKLPVILIMVVVAIIALIFAVTALVRSLHNEDPLPDLSDKLPGQSQEQQQNQPGQPGDTPTAPPVDDAAIQAKRQELLSKYKLRLEQQQAATPGVETPPALTAPMENPKE